jgi:hypothetical protein
LADVKRIRAAERSTSTVPVRASLLFDLENFDLENRSMIFAARVLLDFSQGRKRALAFYIFTVVFCKNKT